MGKNELRPLTKDGYEGSMFGELTRTPGGVDHSLALVSLFWALPSFSGAQRTQALPSALTSLLLKSGAWGSEDGEGQGVGD